MKLYFLVSTLFGIVSSVFGDDKLSLLPDSKTCGLIIKNGAKYPWLVHIPVESRIKGGDPDLRCTGVLISKRYVLTSDSCLKYVLKNVHLGVDDDNKRNPEILQVEERVQSHTNNLLLLRLSKEVQFADYLRPICLPIEDIDKPQYGFFIETSGWGLEDIDGSYVKSRKLVTNLIADDKECERLTQSNDTEKFVCLEEIRGQQILCSGDEGGPLMFPKQLKQYFLAGIVTEKPLGEKTKCTESDRVIGNRMSKSAIEWILENIKP